MCKKLLKIVSILLILTSFFSCAKKETEPEPEHNLILKFDSTAYNLSIGDSIEVKVNVEDAIDLFASSMELVFNGNLLSYIDGSFSIGDFWNNDVTQYAYNDGDTLSFAVVLNQTGGVSGIEGKGTLYKFSLMALSSGETMLRFQNVTLLNNAQTEIEGYSNITIDSSLVTIEQSLTLQFDEVEYIADVGDTIDVDIEILDAVNLFGSAFEITFDDSLLSYVEDSFSEGDFWNGDVTPYSQIDGDTLSSAVTLNQTGGISGITGNGVLCKFKLLSIASGESNLNFQNVSLIDENGEPIENFSKIWIRASSIKVQ